MRVAALILAAGRGARAASNSQKPKQYCRIGGSPVLTHTIRAFTDHPDIDDVWVVVHPEDRPHYREASASFGGSVLKDVAGGPRRQDSVRLGLEALADLSPGLVLIHDAARPFVDGALISRVIETLEDHAGALPCLPVTDTLKRENGGRVSGTVSREGLCRAQTPQGFRFEDILSAHRAAAQDPTLDFTDDAAVAEWFGLEVAVVAGAEQNRKLTTAEDLTIADRIMRGDGAAAGTVRVGTGYDVHAFGPGEAVTLCGVRIPHSKALIGHSDADVGLHALTDALLGAIADGDIGVHFPPSDARWRGAASETFLRAAVDKVRSRGGTVSNVDVMLLCEAPRIGPHREAMRRVMAETLGLDIGQVSVKATTNEQLGFVGREEGIAAMATATVVLP